MLVMMATPIIAPTFGGQILLHEGWRWIFALQVGYAAVAFAVTWAMPETLPSESRLTGTPMDVFAAFRMLAGNRRFVGFALCSAFMSGAIISFLGGSPFLYIVIYHVPTQYYGMLFAINAFGMASLSLFNSRFVMRFGAEKILRVACIWAGVCACVLLAVGIYGVGGLPAIVGALFCVLTTAQLIGTNAMAAALSDVPQMAGTASAAIGIAGSVLGGLAGWATGFFADGSALPILLCVALFSWAALLCNLSLTATAKPSI
jgi:DHA1 family bicyclomycin/chloramphenicol resistance-like MFS transporter